MIGLPGEEVQIQDGSVLVNGKRLVEPYVDPRARGHGNFGPLRVPRGAYFVLGDDRLVSRDSLDFGPILRAAVIGKVIMVLSPWLQQHAPTVPAAQ